MVLIVVEINKSEFQALSDSGSTYFQNGVIFDNNNDDVIAFEKTDFENNDALTYWKVIEKK